MRTEEAVKALLSSPGNPSPEPGPELPAGPSKLPAGAVWGQTFTLPTTVLTTPGRRRLARTPCVGLALGSPIGHFPAATCAHHNTPGHQWSVKQLASH